MSGAWRGGDGGGCGVCVCVVYVCGCMCVRGCVGGEMRERERKSVEAPLHPRLYKCTTALCPLPTTTACRADHSTSVHSNFGSLSLSLSLFPFRCIPSHASPAKVQVEGWNEDDRPRHVHTNDLVPPRHLLQVCTLLYPLFQCGRLRLSPSPNAPSALHDCSYSHTHTCSHTLTLSHTRSLYPCTVSCVR